MTRLLRSSDSKATAFPCPCCRVPLTNAELADPSTPVCISCSSSHHTACRRCGKCVYMPTTVDACVDPWICTVCIFESLVKCGYCEGYFRKEKGREAGEKVVACCSGCLKPNVMGNECGNRGCRTVLTAGQALRKQMICDGCIAFSTMYE